MSKEDAVKCKDCRYCDSEGEYVDAIHRCKKNPPIGKVYINRYDKYDCVGVWPKVKPNSWCGHFLAKPQENK